MDLVGSSIDTGSVSLIGMGFGAGATVLFAARYPGRIRRLVLLSPLLDCKQRFIDEQP